MSELCATLFNLQRFSTEDGPGIRTTAFFKGCPLTCLWCHNPEGMRSAPEVGWKAATCIGCGDCVGVCPAKAISLSPSGVARDRERCEVCGLCVEECPTGSQELIGQEYKLEQLVTEVLKDRTFYETSGGGVTLSGGEPMLQPSFVLEFARRCQQEDLHVALDTSGFALPKRLEAVLAHVDLVLFDLKQIDAQAHRKLAGVPLERVLANLALVAGSGLPVWVRTPVIPGHTDTEENLRGIAEHLAKHLPALERYDLLAFSNLCTAKYEMFGNRFSLADTPLLTAEEMERLAAVVRAAGIESVRWSGPTRKGDEK